MKFNKQINIKKSLLDTFIFLYLWIPVIVFFISWTKWFIGCPVSIICAYYMVKFIKEIYEDYKDSYIGIMLSSLLILIGSILLLGTICGLGEILPQASDWQKHNAVLNDLVNYKWPVYYTVSAKLSMLSYYIGGYIVPAIAGKAFNSFNIASLAMYVWLGIGITLVLVKLIDVLQIQKTREVLLSVFVVCLFSGCLLLSQKSYQIFSNVS